MDFKDTDSVLTRLDALNRVRTERALEMMSQYGRHVFHVLPVLFHYHHPLLPGFARASEQMPSGIVNFNPNPLQKAFLQDIEAHQEVCLQHLLEKETRARDILGLYVMGSFGSLGQGFHSDLDVWLCIDACMHLARRGALQKKCEAISAWARRRGLDVNFFIVDLDTFRPGVSYELDRDSCGSAQRILLLDEFYRSFVTIAGAPIAWLFPQTQQAEHTVSISFGDCERAPAEEYFGAGLWQLYKAIESPYKSLIKTILIEAYSAAYPNTKLLCQAFRERLFECPVDALELDPYLMMFAFVSNYLEQRGDESRLDLVRRCFYLKARDWTKSVGEDTWQNPVLQTLVKQWGWSDDVSDFLNHRAQWDIQDVKKIYAELVHAFMESYQGLIHFAQEHQIISAINPEEMGILSRKVFATFEQFPDKIMRCNLNIAPNLAEKQLFFVCDNSGYTVYQHLQEAQNQENALDTRTSLVALVAWCYFNEILTEQTQITWISNASSHHVQTYSSLFKDMSSTFPQKIIPVKDAALSQPCTLKHLAVFLNFTQDATCDLETEFDESLLFENTLFSWGETQQNLIGSIDAVYLNSWHEIRTLSHDADQNVLEVTCTLLRKMYVEAKPPQVKVYNYGQVAHEKISAKFHAWLLSCYLLWKKSRYEKKVLKTVKLKDKRYCFIFEQCDVKVLPVENTLDFYHQLATGKSPLTQETDLFPVPNELLEYISAYASEGLLQFFIEVNAHGHSIIILDEHNRMTSFQDETQDTTELVQQMYHIFAKNHQTPIFNWPQFYELERTQTGWKITPYKSARAVV